MVRSCPQTRRERYLLAVICRWSIMSQLPNERKRQERECHPIFHKGSWVESVCGGNEPVCLVHSEIGYFFSPNISYLKTYSGSVGPPRDI